MNFFILASLCCFVIVVNAATVPLTDEQSNNPALIRQRRSPLILTALGAAGLIGAGIVKAGLAGLAGAGLVGAGLGAKAGFTAGALAGSAARSYGGYYYNYGQYEHVDRDYEYRAQVRVRV